MSHCKDPYKPTTSIIECHKFFFRGSHEFVQTKHRGQKNTSITSCAPSKRRLVVEQTCGDFLLVSPGEQ